MEANLEQYSEPCWTFKIKVLAKIVAAFSFWQFRKKLYITFCKILNSNLLPVTTWGKSSIHMWRGFWIRLCSNWLFSIRFILDIWQSSECVSAIYTTTIIKRLPVRSVGYLLNKFRHASNNIVRGQIHVQIHFMFDMSSE